jgi:hypothetical protein
MALGLTQPPIQQVPGDLSQGVKWLGCEADHSLPSSAKVKECMELYLHSASMPSWHGAQLKKKHRDNFTLPYDFALEMLCLKNEFLYCIGIEDTFWMP